MKAVNFLNLIRQEKRQFAVIGLGRFGRAVCETLYHNGYEVLGVDQDEKLVAEILADRVVANAMTLDSTDDNALREAGIFEIDTVIVAIGNYLKESIITAMNLKEAGVKHVVAKVSSDTHEKILRRLGVDLIVFPEQEAGQDLAYRLTKPAIVDRFKLDPENSIVEILAPEEFCNKTLAELELRKNYGVSVLAIGNEKKFKINPSPQDRLQKGMIMVLIGLNENINKLV
ncbi:MAG: NAD-dependent epimerase/dehydratase family protein [Cyanobacteria bacterium RI_101]|nr:NAD-dependent epimerase/dehydratase family protein [Cyanobacteria bacterium RI_101]